MKNLCLLPIAIALCTFFGNAQIIEDDFEFYTLGDMADQNPTVWSTWSGDVLDGTAIQVVEVDGGQAGFIGPGSVQDALLLLGNLTAGDYCYHMDLFITAGSTGYFNIQGETETNAGTGYEGAGNGGAGVFNSGNLYFNQAGAAPGVFLDETSGETGTYPEDAWFHVQIYFDVDNLEYTITVDGTLVNIVPVPFQADATLGALDLFSIDANNNMFVDNVLFVEGIIDDIDDYAVNNVKVFPNPVEDILQIRSVESVEEVSVYDVLGNLVFTDTLSGISQEIDMSNLPSGIYLVEITIGVSSRTLKIVK